MNQEESVKPLDLLPIKHKKLKDAVRNPKFGKESAMRDWRNHIHEGVKKIWPYLSEETRLIFVLGALKVAEKEKW